MQPTTYDTETELSAVNTILGSIGQSPVQSLEYENPEVSFAHNLLITTSLDVQNEGWVFNREQDYVLTPAGDDMIYIPDNILRMDVSLGQIWRTTDVVKRDGKLYDKLHHSYFFTGPIHLDIVWLFPFTDLPSVFKRYTTFRAAGRAATQLVGNSELVKLLATQEAQTRASCMEYECNQGDYTYFGTPEHTAYKSFQPYIALHR